jgi:hypothetical protein
MSGGGVTLLVLGVLVILDGPDMRGAALITLTIVLIVTWSRMSTGRSAIARGRDR